MKTFLKILPVLLLSFLGVTNPQAMTPQALTPVLGNVDLYHLEDKTYFFPAKASPGAATVFLPLRRWDLIFTGDHINPPDDTLDWENINYLIPGPFNHLMVYMGKDSRGLAYAVELSVLSLNQGGVLALICLGSDFGILRHPDTAFIHDRRRMTHCWARRFVDAAHDQIVAHEEALVARIHNDLITDFPYQVEIEHSGNILDKAIYLVDDGFEGGASCSDYWTTLFEAYADLCIKNVRMGVEEIEDYFYSDPLGRLTYVPPELSPFPGKIFVWQLLDLGFKTMAAPPHVHACDGSEETGVVLPSLIMESDLLQEIAPLNLPLLNWGSE